MTPSTATQFVILIVFVIPGLVYQTVRARLAGEAPQNRDMTNKFLRALAASVVLASVYMIILGPMLVDALGGDAHDTRQWLTKHARLTGLLALVLLFAVPAIAATVAARRWHIGKRIAAWRARGPFSLDAPLGASRIARRMNRLLAWIGERSDSRGGLRYDPTPTAWDWAVDHGADTQAFVRILGPDGAWKGGALGSRSYFTTYPEPPAVFVERAWQVDETGGFVAEQDRTRGAWIPCEGARTVEFVGPSADRGDHDQEPYHDEGGTHVAPDEKQDPNMGQA
jgi:hypothetical protein